MKLNTKIVFKALVVLVGLLEVLVVEGCPSCVEREQFMEFTKKSIKVEILRKLGMYSAPNITLEIISQNHLVKNLIHKLEVEEGRGMLADQPSHSMHEDDHFQPAEVNIIPSQPPAEVSAEHRHWNILYYKMRGWASEEEVGSLIEASLMLHLPAAPSPQDTTARVRVYYVGVDKKTRRFTQFKAKEGTWELRQDRGGVVKIDLGNLVRKWLRNPTENLGIVMRVETNTRTELPVPAHHSHTAPYLQLIYGDKASNSRYKRNTNMQCTEEFDADVKECCMWPLTIDFNEFGWDWVLFPRTYDANFCSGECSLGVVPESPHTHMLQMNTHSTAGPCCAARQMAGISMLYLDEYNNVVLGKLPGMKVERCGCL